MKSINSDKYDLIAGSHCCHPLTIENVEYSIRLNENKLKFYEKTRGQGLQIYIDTIERLKIRLKKLTE
ncbi:hypothetical protein [Chryseobacterium sp. MP_3.2]|uniref:hypothetical protein n=1 Tax=Chryseobacterium sp. MP_3.2 TaxID=3071712 RepID=UPI002E07E891|nr:hypothetical protein [Chryseobacterium sp. MP_3.2]